MYRVYHYVHVFIFLLRVSVSLSPSEGTECAEAVRHGYRHVNTISIIIKVGHGRIVK
jgi:hypothetical protein